MHIQTIAFKGLGSALSIHLQLSRSFLFEQIFIQSDIQDVAVDMREYFDAESDKLVHIDNVNPNMICDDEGWLSDNPMGIRTEREIHAEFEGARIYRRMYQKQW